MKVKTNHNWRQFVRRHDVPQSVLDGDLDWTDDSYKDEYLRYKNHWYHTSMFVRTRYTNEWDGAHSESFSSGALILIKISPNREEYQIGTLTKE